MPHKTFCVCPHIFTKGHRNGGRESKLKTSAHILSRRNSVSKDTINLLPFTEELGNTVAWIAR